MGRACVCFIAWWVCDTLSALPGGANERFHVIQVALEGAAARCRQTVLGLRHPSLEALGAGDVLRPFQLSGVDTQIAIGRLHQLLEIAEAEGIVDRERADDAEPQTLVNESVEGVGA